MSSLYIYIQHTYLGARGGDRDGARIHYITILLYTITTEDRVTPEKFRTPKTRRHDNMIEIKTYTYITV